MQMLVFYRRWSLTRGVSQRRDYCISQVPHLRYEGRQMLNARLVQPKVNKGPEYPISKLICNDVISFDTVI